MTYFPRRTIRCSQNHSSLLAAIFGIVVVLYAIQTLQHRATTDSGARHMSLAGIVAEPAWSTVSIYGDPEQFLLQFRSVPPEAGNLFAAQFCQSEVCNGGLDQFFSNSTGILAPEALAAYREMGIDEWASILEEAMSKFGTPYPRDRETRQRLLYEIQNHYKGGRDDWDQFRELDNRFYAWLHADFNRFDKVAEKYASRFAR